MSPKGRWILERVDTTGGEWRIGFPCWDAYWGYGDYGWTLGEMSA